MLGLLFECCIYNYFFIDRICKLDKMDLEYSESTRLARQSFVHSVSNILVSTDAIIARLTRNREAAAI